MTRDDIIKLAREAGIEEVLEGADDWICFTEELVRFAALVAAAEREECADECVKLALKGGFAADCAAAIRSRT